MPEMSDRASGPMSMDSDRSSDDPTYEPSRSSQHSPLQESASASVHQSAEFGKHARNSKSPPSSGHMGSSPLRQDYLPTTPEHGMHPIVEEVPDVSDGFPFPSGTQEMPQFRRNLQRNDGDTAGLEFHPAFEGLRHQLPQEIRQFP